MSQKVFFSISYIVACLMSVSTLVGQSYAAGSGKVIETSPKSTFSSPAPKEKNDENKDTNESRETEKTESGSNMTDSNSEESLVESKEEQKIKQDINAYIIESYKVQGTKIIKDLSTKLTKTIPDEKDRQEAYRKIRDSLELRLEKTERLKMSETKKLILKEFLTHMIDLLDKKIEELK